MLAKQKTIKLVVILVLLMFSGCAGIDKQNLNTFDGSLKAGQYKQACDIALDKCGIDKKYSSNDLLWVLQSGTILGLTEDYSRSNRFFDQAEVLMKGEDTENVVIGGLKKVGAVLVNNSINSYGQTVFDSVMVNTYKGLNNIFLKDWKNGRIEFNRAADRQRRAKEHFTKKITAQKKKLAREKKKSSGKKLNIGRAEEAVNKNYKEMNSWKAYGDYLNPYTDYLHGLYFMLGAEAGNMGSDYEKAVFSINRVAGTHGRNSVITNDLNMARNLQSGAWRRHKIRPQVWVIFENGLAPTLDEIRITVPLFVAPGQAGYTHLALPKLKLEPKAYDSIKVSSQGRTLGQTKQIASIDRVVQSEFKKNLPYMITEAIISAIAKGVGQAVIQKGANETGNPIVALFTDIGGVIYKETTSHVDMRSWTSLPKEVQALRVRKPKSSTLTLTAKGMSPVDVHLPKNRFSIVHVRAFGHGALPIIRVAGFD